MLAKGLRARCAAQGTVDVVVKKDTTPTPVK